MQTEIEKLPNTNYKGSKKNYESVKSQLLERYGSEIASEYNPLENCRTYNDWRKNNYLVNHGARSFKAVVVVEKEDKKTGKITKIPRTICLFFRNQVKKVN